MPLGLRDVSKCFVNLGLSFFTWESVWGYSEITHAQYPDLQQPPPPTGAPGANSSQHLQLLSTGRDGDTPPHLLATCRQEGRNKPRIETGLCTL